MINKSLAPRIFTRSNITAAQLPVDWHANNKAWMRHDIFQKYLTNLESYFAILQRKILLLVDNASSHIVDDENKYPHVKVYFLPPNTTAHIQPMVVQSFKMQYKKLYLLHALDRYDNGMPDWGKIEVLAAVQMVAEGWATVSGHTIRNCWRKTGIIPVLISLTLFPPAIGDDVDDPMLPEDEDAATIEQRDSEMAVGAALESRSNADLNSSILEFLGETERLLIEEEIEEGEIVNLVLSVSLGIDGNESGSAESEGEQPRVTFREAKHSAAVPQAVRL